MDDYFAIVPASVRYDKTLSPLDRNVYIEIAARCNSKGHCWPSNKTLGEFLGCHCVTVSRSIKRLISAGYVMVGTKEHVRYLYIPLSTEAKTLSTEAKTLSVQAKTPLSVQAKQRSIKNKKNTEAVFVIPTIEEVKEYALSKFPGFDYQNFFDYFTDGDWVDSKGQKVRNWKQKMRTWATSKKETTSQQKKPMRPQDGPPRFAGR